MEFGDYEAVLQFVEDVILQQKTVTTMKKLYKIYKLHPDDTKYHHKLNNRCPDVVIASDSIE